MYINRQIQIQIQIRTLSTILSDCRATFRYRRMSDLSMAPAERCSNCHFELHNEYQELPPICVHILAACPLVWQAQTPSAERVSAR
jgi:hypothetical protein